jgi:hypothetical protein
MKKIIAVALILSLSLISLPLFAASLSSGGGWIAATNVETETNLGGRSHLYLYNNGANTATIKLGYGDAVTAVAGTDFSLDATQSITIEAEELAVLSTICGTGNTASVKYLTWD